MKRIILLLIMACFLVGCNQSLSNEIESSVKEENTDVPVTLTDEGIYQSKYATISKQEWESIDSSNTRYESAEAFLEEVDYYVVEIATILGREDWLEELSSQEIEDNRRIEFTFTTTISQANGGGATYSEKFVKPYVALNRDEFEYGHLLITHELTHVVSTYTMSWTLSEGLACFMQDKVSLNNKNFLFEGDIFENTKYLFDEGFDYTIEHLGTLENGKNNPQTSDRYELLAFYVTSSSFAKYIESNYGLDKYLELYNSDCKDESYIQIFDMTREELIQAFKDFINNI